MIMDFVMDAKSVGTSYVDFLVRSKVKIDGLCEINRHCGWYLYRGKSLKVDRFVKLKAYDKIRLDFTVFEGNIFASNVTDMESYHGNCRVGEECV